MPSYIHTRSKSFGHAFRGMAVLLRTQPNARIHLTAAIVVIAAGIAFGISLAEWGLIAVAVLCVWVAEAFNTAIEFLVDLLSPEMHLLAGTTKDVAAAAVLLAAIGAAVIGLIVFWPHVLQLMR